MTWIAVVFALPEGEEGPMRSRLPSFLHPVAGRPLIWHTLGSLLAAEVPPLKIIVVAPPGLTNGVLTDLPVEVEVVPPGETDATGFLNTRRGEDGADRLLATHASASISSNSIDRLVAAEEGSWIAAPDESVIAVLVDGGGLGELTRLETPFATRGGLPLGGRRLVVPEEDFIVRSRADLAAAHSRIRDTLVQSLMEAGVTFLLPESVALDVGVRIGRDSVIYPGVVLEGQTTVGEETVVGPGCRIIDSWIGSGVELKGWNYIAHTSVRNRAILEPYVRRGFD